MIAELVASILGVAFGGGIDFSFYVVLLSVTWFVSWYLEWGFFALCWSLFVNSRKGVKAVLVGASEKFNSFSVESARALEVLSRPIFESVKKHNIAWTSWLTSDGVPVTLLMMLPQVYLGFPWVLAALYSSGYMWCRLVWWWWRRGHTGGAPPTSFLTLTKHWLAAYFWLKSWFDWFASMKVFIVSLVCFSLAYLLSRWLSPLTKRKETKGDETKGRSAHYNVLLKLAVACASLVSMGTMYHIGNMTEIFNITGWIHDLASTDEEKCVNAGNGCRSTVIGEDLCYSCIRKVSQKMCDSMIVDVSTAENTKMLAKSKSGCVTLLILLMRDSVKGASLEWFNRLPESLRDLILSPTGIPSSHFGAGNKWAFARDDNGAIIVVPMGADVMYGRATKEQYQQRFRPGLGANPKQTETPLSRAFAAFQAAHMHTPPSSPTLSQDSLTGSEHSDLRHSAEACDLLRRDAWVDDLTTSIESIRERHRVGDAEQSESKEDSDSEEDVFEEAREASMAGGDLFLPSIPTGQIDEYEPFNPAEEPFSVALADLGVPVNPYGYFEIKNKVFKFVPSVSWGDNAVTAWLTAHYVWLVSHRWFGRTARILLVTLVTCFMIFAVLSYYPRQIERVYNKVDGWIMSWLGAEVPKPSDEDTDEGRKVNRQAGHDKKHEVTSSVGTGRRREALEQKVREDKHRDLSDVAQVDNLRPFFFYDDANVKTALGQGIRMTRKDSPEVIVRSMSELESRRKQGYGMDMSVFKGNTGNVFQPVEGGQVSEHQLQTFQEQLRVIRAAIPLGLEAVKQVTKKIPLAQMVELSSDLGEDEPESKTPYAYSVRKMVDDTVKFVSEMHESGKSQQDLHKSVQRYVSSSPVMKSVALPSVTSSDEKGSSKCQRVKCFGDCRLVHSGTAVRNAKTGGLCYFSKDASAEARHAWKTGDGNARGSNGAVTIVQKPKVTVSTSSLSPGDEALVGGGGKAQDQVLPVVGQLVRFNSSFDRWVSLVTEDDCKSWNDFTDVKKRIVALNRYPARDLWNDAQVDAFEGTVEFQRLGHVNHIGSNRSLTVEHIDDGSVLSAYAVRFIRQGREFYFPVKEITHFDAVAENTDFSVICTGLGYDELGRNMSQAEWCGKPPKLVAHKPKKGEPIQFFTTGVHDGCEIFPHVGKTLETKAFSNELIHDCLTAEGFSGAGYYDGEGRLIAVHKGKKSSGARYGVCWPEEFLIKLNGGAPRPVVKSSVAGDAGSLNV